MWFPVAMTEAEQGRKEVVDSRSAELDLALMKQTTAPAGPLTSDTRNCDVEFHCVTCC